MVGARFVLVTPDSEDLLDLLNIYIVERKRQPPQDPGDTRVIFGLNGVYDSLITYVQVFRQIFKGFV